jgi:hypothetical protein
LQATPEDYMAITELMARYCMTLSVHDTAAWVDLFTADGSFKVYGRSWDGHERLRSMVEATSGGLHLGGQPIIEMVDKDNARTTRNLFVVDRKTGGTRCAVYDDELQRTQAGWRIASTRCRFITTDGLSDRPPR